MTPCLDVASGEGGRGKGHPTVRNCYITVLLVRSLRQRQRMIAAPSLRFQSHVFFEDEKEKNSLLPLSPLSHFPSDLLDRQRNCCGNVRERRKKGIHWNRYFGREKESPFLQQKILLLCKSYPSLPSSILVCVIGFHVSRGGEGEEIGVSFPPFSFPFRPCDLLAACIGTCRKEGKESREEIGLIRSSPPL